MTERWRAIEGFPAYEVSDFGRVRSLDRTISFVRAGVKRTLFVRGRMLQITVGSHGYGQVCLSDRGEATQSCVHVLVANAFNGPCPAGLHVLHDDGNNLNCRASNLYYGNQIQNIADARRHGTIANGEKNGKAKLTIEQVRVIRKAPGLYADIADQFDVSPSNIGQIKRRETWAGIT